MLRISLSNSKIACRVGFDCGKGAQLPDQRALGHFLEAQRGHDLIDVDFLIRRSAAGRSGQPAGSGISRTARDRRRSIVPSVVRPDR